MEVKIIIDENDVVRIIKSFEMGCELLTLKTFQEREFLELKIGKDVYLEIVRRARLEGRKND